MPPCDLTRLTLEETGSPRDPLGNRTVVHGHPVEIACVIRTIRPSLERRGEPPGILADVEKGYEVPARRGIHVGDEDLRQGALVQHRAQSLPVLIAYGGDDHALPRVDAKVEPPVLPVHLVPLHDEAGTLR